MNDHQHEKRVRERAAVLLEEAIDCPFEPDKKKWDRWCDKWRARALASIRELRE